jgi:hypothetical protein
MDRLKDLFSSGTGYNSAPTGSRFSYIWLAVGIAIAALVGLVLYMVLGRAETRPVKQGFYGGPINGTSSLPCGRMSSEAEELMALFEAKQLNVGEEGKADLHDLRNLLSKMCCMKQDLMAPQHLIAATKEMGFETHMDIQPVADLIGRCFSKTVPERDLSVQFIKWRDYGVDLLRRLCTAASLSEAEVLHAEKLLFATWKDVQDVAMTTCLSSVGEGAFKQSPHEAAPHTPEQLQDLRPYDGLY